jgi:hypothetical protein
VNRYAAPEGFEGFNPDKKFVVMFDLRFEKSNSYVPFAMMQVVWIAPELPRPGDNIHIGRMPNDFVIRIPTKPFLAPENHTSWSDGSHATIDAVLLHLTEPEEFIEQAKRLIVEHPDYRATFHASLHIDTAMMMSRDQ